MNKNILWDEDMDVAYGEKIDFKNEQEFTEKVGSEYLKIRGFNCIVSDVKLESCICTSEGLGAETLIPLSETDIEIKNYYIVDVEGVEE